MIFYILCPIPISIFFVTLYLFRKKASSKVSDRFRGLKTREQIAQEHATQRMTEGITVLLTMHSPSELSSICGVLKLKSLERGHSSIEQIVNHLKSVNVGGQVMISEAKLHKVLENIWEGPIHEYLASIGHPQLQVRCLLSLLIKFIVFMDNQTH